MNYSLYSVPPACSYPAPEAIDNLHSRQEKIWTLISHENYAIAGVFSHCNAFIISVVGGIEA
jgi:predicted nucleic acid-binding Zn finger protein